MGFEIVERGEWLPGSPMKEGECSISSSGHLCFRQADLALIEITGAAVVLADTATLRLAVRRPRDQEARNAMVVSTVTNHQKRDTGRRTIAGARAIKRLSLEPRACRGRYPLTTKDDLPIINLADAEFGSAEKGGTSARRE